MNFPIFKTRIENLNQTFNFNDIEERRRYFEAKAGLEIEELRRYFTGGGGGCSC